MTPEQYKDALEVLELLKKALTDQGQPEQRHVQAYLDLYATVEDIAKSHGLPQRAAAALLKKES